MCRHAPFPIEDCVRKDFMTSPKVCRCRPSSLRASLRLGNYQKIPVQQNVLFSDVKKKLLLKLLPTEKYHVQPIRAKECILPHPQEIGQSVPLKKLLVLPSVNISILVSRAWNEYVQEHITFDLVYLDALITSERG